MEVNAAKPVNAGTNFANETEAEAWLAAQDIETRCAVILRIALRVVSELHILTGSDFERSVLTCFRAILFSTVRATKPHQTNSFEFEKNASDLSIEAGKLARSIGSSYDSSPNVVSTAAYAARAAVSRGFAKGWELAAFLPYAKSGLGDAFEKLDEAWIARRLLEQAASSDSVTNLNELLKTKLWGDELAELAFSEHKSRFVMALQEDVAWAFWLRFYDGMWNGTFTDWHLAFEVIKIKAKEWKKGYEHIGALIAEIEARLADGTTNSPPSKIQSNAFAQRANENTQAIALTAASLIEQLAVYREVVRCSNSVDSEERQALLDFIDHLNSSLEQLLGLLPKPNEVLDEIGGSKLVLWFREFKALIPKEAAKYVTPANVTTAAVPTSIILSGTAIGTLIGGPAGGGVGALVGGLLTNQIKPGKAADEIMKQDPETPTE